jgi:hypothetical protein
MNWALLGGSLAAVLAVAAVAWMLRLGGGAIGGPEEACRMAEEILSGFDAREALVGVDGRAALVHGRDGSAALLKQHGARIAGRRLAPPFAATPSPDGLVIDSGETSFGRVTLRGIESISR